MRMFLIIISILYFLTVISALCINNEEYGAANLGLNGMGDYLAGFLSPLAFVWLAYGYLLQADQIKKNTITSNRAETLSMQQFNYQKIKEQNDAQPVFFIDSFDEIEEKDLTYIDIYSRIKGPSIYNFKTVGGEAFQVLKKIVKEDEKIHFHLRLDTKEVKNVKSYFKKIEDDLNDIKNSEKIDFQLLIRTHAKTFTSKKIKTVNFQYLDKLGLTQKNKLEIWYSNNGFHVDIGHNIKEQDESMVG